jgi:hypothetical protein
MHHLATKGEELQELTPNSYTTHKERALVHRICSKKDMSIKLQAKSQGLSNLKLEVRNSANPIKKLRFIQVRRRTSKAEFEPVSNSKLKTNGEFPRGLDEVRVG